MDVTGIFSPMDFQESTIGDYSGEEGGKSSKLSQQKRICIVGNLQEDTEVCNAAKTFGVPIVFSANGVDVLDETTYDTVFVLDDFSGPVFVELRRLKCRIIGPTALKEKAAKKEFPRNARPLFCQAMCDKFICLTGFRDVDHVARLVDLVHNMGGGIRKYISSKNTHLVAAQCCGEKYKYAVTFNIPVMSDAWVFKNWERRGEAGASCNDKEMMIYKMKPFGGSRISFFGFSEEERRHMIDVLIENGGTYTEMTDPSCTHVVVEGGEAYDILKADMLPRKVLGVLNSTVPSFKIPLLPLPISHSKCGRSRKRCKLQEESFIDPVMDELSVSTAPEKYSGSPFIVKAEWFWTSVQIDGRAEEEKYVFEDQADVISPVGTHSDSGSSSRKRKRKRLNISRSVQNESPVSHRRRSSISDVGYLSMSGSFLDCTSSPDHREDGQADGDTPKKLTPRHQVFLELVQTEENYVGILDTIITIFKNQLEDGSGAGGPLLNNTEIKKIFGDIPPIYEVHKEILDELKWSASHWKEGFSLGNIYMKVADKLITAYPPFVNSFEDMKETLARCDQTKPRFHAFLKVCQTKPECGRETLQDLLIRPVQRLPSVSLLLNDILKHTPKNNPDYAALARALDKIREVMTHINEDKRKAEGLRVMFNIFNEIDNCPPDLVSSHRTFVEKCDVAELSDELSGKGDSLHLFLFSDVLEVCKKRSKAFGTLRSPSTASLHSLKLSASKPFKHVKLLSLQSIKKVVNIKERDDCHNAFALMCRNHQEMKDKLYSFSILDEETNKTAYLKTLCRQIANTVCKTDYENLLISLDAKQLDIDTTDVSTSTLSRAVKFAAKTRHKVGKAFTFSKTPNKLKRAVSTMISPFGSSSNVTPSTQLSQMRLGSCNNLTELASPVNVEPTAIPSSVQPTRKVKSTSLSMAALRRL